MAAVKKSDKIALMKAGYWVGFIALREKLGEQGKTPALASREALSKVLPLAQRKLAEMEDAGVDVENMRARTGGPVMMASVQGKELEALEAELAETRVVGGEVVDAPGTIKQEYGGKKDLDIPELSDADDADAPDAVDEVVKPETIAPPELSADQEASLGGIVGIPSAPPAMGEAEAVKAEEFDRQMKWVVAVLERKGTVKAEDAPSGMAWAYYRMCKDSVAFREKFLMKMLDRMLPRDMSGGGAETDEDDLGVEKGLVEYMAEVAELARGAESDGNEPKTGD